MKKQILLLPLFVAALCLSAKAASFAYVNTEDILQNSKEFKECEKRALAKRDVKTEEIAQMTAQLDKLQGQIAALSPEKAAPLREQYARDFDRIERYREQSAEDITAQHSHDMERIAGKIRAIIEAVGSRDNVTMMLDLKAILYLDPKVVKDYTKEVTNELNRQYDEELSKLRSKLPLNK
ncbi:OmpH family outer membrane protein [bacterium]|nr:OmpH family outer membrane protein [bacterium]